MSNKCPLCRLNNTPADRCPYVACPYKPEENFGGQVEEVMSLVPQVMSMKEQKLGMENFEAVVMEQGGNTSLSVTQNGWEWTTLVLSREQLQEVRDRIDGFIELVGGNDG